MLGVAFLIAPAAAAPGRENQVTVLEREGRVEAVRAGATAWTAAQTNQILRVADRVRTGERSRATLHLLDQSTLRMFELSEFLIEPLPDAPDRPVFSLSKGLLYFFHRDKAVDVQFKTRTATAAIRGTEFHLAVADNGRTVLTMFDGEVDLSNAFGAIQLKSGEQGVVEPGQAPVKTAVIDARNIIQWCLYYPGVLDVDELRFDVNEQAALQDSLTAYRAGDLLAALAAYPEGRRPTSEAEKTFYAALLLGVGKVDQAETLLPSEGRPAAALRALIAAVKNVPATNTLLLATNSATEALARSYQLQAQAKLPEALRAAEASVAHSPLFGFGWARVAELEFSFGHTKPALAALDKSLALAPRNAGAVALRGFAFVAQNRIREATAEFNRAIALDGALGNAWLGRGLCRIRRGDVSGGRGDLQVAATLEPQRALLRSYLGKAWSELGNFPRAERELALAKARDANDPTAWLYSALLLEQGNRINEAVGELEQSQKLNDNRRVYRSRLLLDQDRAVGGANLANIYRDAGMADVSVREAGKAVNADYANYSAHLFLANSYNELRDPQGVNLRYETPFVSEYLLANLLAPVGAGTLSQQVSQQEYAKLFERDRFGFASATEYLSRGAWSQSAVQFGTFGNTSYALEADYLSDPGQRRNQDVEQMNYSLQLKHQVSPADSIYFQLLTGDAHTGDLNQYTHAAQADPSIRVRDEQQPIALVGYHHEWGPGSHSLLLLSRLESRLRVEDAQAGGFLYRANAGPIDLLRPMQFQQSYDSSLEIYGAELQQIWQGNRHTLVVGGRGQFGDFDTANQHRLTGADAFDFIAFELNDPVPQRVSTPFARGTAYAYWFWQVWEPFQVVGGLAYDWIKFPRDYRFAPITTGTDIAEGVLPKLGWQWFLATNSVVRFAWTRSLSGASFDQSFRLEPVQVAGFNQAFRSIIPETLTGANAGAPFETFGLAWEHRFASRTCLGLGGEWLRSNFDRRRGAYSWTADGPVVPSSVVERLGYEEKNVRVTLDQLLGRDWEIGARYQWSRAQLDQSFPNALPLVQTGDFLPNGDPQLVSSRSRLRGDLHQVGLQARFNHPSGIFAGTEGVWYGQTAASEAGHLASSWFWQWHAHCGWRSPQRRVEVSLAVLNILDQAQGLHPINLHSDPPQRRTLAVSCRLNF